MKELPFPKTCRGVRLSGFGESGLSLIYQRFKRFRLVDRNIGKDFAINFDAGFAQTMHKLRIGHTVQAGSSIDTLNPQTPEGPLFGATVAICVLTCFLDPLDGGPENIFITAAVTFGLL